MTLEPVNDFFSNIKEKLTNPFFSTLIFVWLVRNWELVYSIFNFDECYTLETKKQFIVGYYSNKTICKELFINIGIALLLMLLGYILLFLTRTFTTWFDFSLTPWVTGKVINSKVVQRELYDEVFKERNEYAEMYEEQRKIVRTTSKDFDEINKSFQELTNLYSKQTKELNEATKNNAKLNNQLNKLDKDLGDLKIKQENEFNNLVFENKRFKNLYENNENDLKEFYKLFEDKNFINKIEFFPSKVSNAANFLKRDNKVKQFSSVANFLSKGGSIDSILLSDMLKYDVVYKSDSNSNDYRLSPVGWILYNNWTRFFP